MKGRPKGAKNKTTQQRYADMVAGGITPLEYLLNILRDATIEHQRRLDAAKAAAPYIHPRLAQTEISGNPEKPVEHKLKIEFVRPGE